MAGKFRVVGVLRLADRGLVAYGEVVEGTVARGEVLAIPLNSRVAISPMILSVEMVDGTAAGSHVGLLISSSHELEMDLVEALNFAGETLDVRPATVDPEAATFDEGARAGRRDVHRTTREGERAERSAACDPGAVPVAVVVVSYMPRGAGGGAPPPPLRTPPGHGSGVRPA